MKVPALEAIFNSKKKLSKIELRFWRVPLPISKPDLIWAIRLWSFNRMQLIFWKNALLLLWKVDDQSQYSKNYYSSIINIIFIFICIIIFITNGFGLPAAEEDDQQYCWQFFKRSWALAVWYLARPQIWQKENRLRREETNSDWSF